MKDGRFDLESTLDAVLQTMCPDRDLSAAERSEWGRYIHHRFIEEMVRLPDHQTLTAVLGSQVGQAEPLPSQNFRRDEEDAVPAPSAAYRLQASWKTMTRDLTEASPTPLRVSGDRTWRTAMPSDWLTMQVATPNKAADHQQPLEEPRTHIPAAAPQENGEADTRKIIGHSSLSRKDSAGSM